MKTRPGITSYAASRETDAPSSAFYLIFDKNMIETVCHETNRQGVHCTL